VFGDTPPEKPLPDLPEWSSDERLTGEKEVLGFYVTGHPLEQFRGKMADLASHPTDGLEGLERGVEVTLCGILTTIQKRRNKEGKVWAAMQLEDLSGAIDAVLFANGYERLAEHLVEDKAVLLKGLVLPEEGAPPKISIQDLVPLELAGMSFPSLISIRVPLGRAGDLPAALGDLFRRKAGETSVRLRLEKARDFSLLLDVAERVRPDREFQADVARLCGAEAFEVLAK
jgi:DNA polymerase-3 subunit alpha